MRALAHSVPRGAFSRSPATVAAPVAFRAAASRQPCSLRPSRLAAAFSSEPLPTTPVEKYRAPPVNEHGEPLDPMGKGDFLPLHNAPAHDLDWKIWHHRVSVLRRQWIAQASKKMDARKQELLDKHRTIEYHRMLRREAKGRRKAVLALRRGELDRAKQQQKELRRRFNEILHLRREAEIRRQKRDQIMLGMAIESPLWITEDNVDEAITDDILNTTASLRGLPIAGEFDHVETVVKSSDRTFASVRPDADAETFAPVPSTDERDSFAFLKAYQKHIDSLTDEELLSDEIGADLSPAEHQEAEFLAREALALRYDAAALEESAAAGETPSASGASSAIPPKNV